MKKISISLKGGGNEIQLNNDIVIKDIKISNSSIYDYDLEDLNFKNVIFKDCQILLNNFVRCTFTNCKFISTDIERCQFMTCNFENVIFENNTNLFYNIFEDTHIVNCTFNKIPDLKNNTWSRCYDDPPGFRDNTIIFHRKPFLPDFYGLIINNISDNLVLELLIREILIYGKDNEKSFIEWALDDKKDCPLEFMEIYTPMCWNIDAAHAKKVLKQHLENNGKIESTMTDEDVVNRILSESSWKYSYPQSFQENN